ncbi:hypothetical protein H8S37_04355 [Mediterraneibacter sp. NSJ-55]|uniref:Uncharacterized protein n=1 Tax=Mediterraneibacter hominis TaxID=2763054 RepID=A0A923LG94_9FIRM|nr:hypothetical protein [Mediterraneibacter hominis]MBC5688165.1 hypothetical protein [Mediterraneibacter hominis]
MKNKKSEFDNTATNELKKQYISLCFGKMIYGINTDIKRNKIAEEIDKREFAKMGNFREGITL